MINKIICVLIFLSLSGCNPYGDLYPTAQPTATTTATAIPPTETPIPSPVIESLTCTVKTGIDAGLLNLRTGAGMQHAIVRVLHEGELLTVITRGDWHEVTDTQGNHGFINSHYCEGV